MTEELDRQASEITVGPPFSFFDESVFTPSPIFNFQYEQAFIKFNKDRHHIYELNKKVAKLSATNKLTDTKVIVYP